MVRKKSILKDAIREISLNKKKFISLLLIIVIGSGFYVGLKMTSYDMMKTAKKYYKEANLFDLKLESSTGFSKSDYYMLKSLEEVKGVSLSKTLNVTATVNNKDYVIKLNSLNENRSLNNEDYINRLTLIKGRYPKTINEGLVEESFLIDNNLSLDDLITLKPEDENDLRAKKIKIVGVVKSSYYTSLNIEANTLKNKKIDYFMYLEENDFSSQYYDEGYITIKGAEKYDTYKKEYDNYINKYINNINEKILESTTLTQQKKMQMLNDEIEELSEQLNRLNETDLPTESLNDSIKEVSNELEKNKQELSKVTDPIAYSVKRSQTHSFSEYKSEIKKIESITKIFPFVFFMVAILIVMSSMTRMIEEEKENIGTLRAIGYDKTAIIFKYVLYALLISLLGNIIGILLFYKTIPLLVSYLYKTFYDMPIMITNFQVKPALFVILTSCTLIMIACMFTFVKLTKKTPNELIKLSSPKKRKINFPKKMWSRLSFSNKLVLKNLLRCKKRLIMPVVGICGFIVLILTTFGIKDSVNKTIEKQYNKINKYNMIIHVNKDASKEDKNKIQNDLINNDEVKKLTYIYKSNVTVRNKSEINNAFLVVPKSQKEINNFINLKSRKKINLTNNGVIITKKLAKVLNIKRGDKIKIAMNDKQEKNVIVSDITENYADNYVYMSPTLYKKLTKKEANYSTLLTINKKLNRHEKQVLESKISKINGIKSVEIIPGAKKVQKEIISTLKPCFIILICFTTILTFTILLNLVTTLLTEKKEELVVAKTLGFYNKEVAKHICKEISIITTISSIIGLILGTFIAFYVINFLKINTFIFCFNISMKNYLSLILIIIIFLLLTNLLTHFSLKKLSKINSFNDYE